MRGKLQHSFADMIFVLLNIKNIILQHRVRATWPHFHASKETDIMQTQGNNGYNDK